MHPLALSLAALLAAAPGLCAAETLQDAIALAYQDNPTLRAQRAELRSVDETYVQARAGFGPQVNFNGQVGAQQASIPENQFGFPTTTNYRAGTATADLSAVQPLYTSGAATAQSRGASAAVLAARETLRQAEAQVLLNVVTAYLDVRRDRQIVQALREQIAALDRASEETRARGSLGELSRTDVAQSQARLFSAQSQLSLAVGRLNVSNAEYVAAVGQTPGELAPEPDLVGVPVQADEAFDAAEHNNPQLLEAVQNERAAREKVSQAKAANGPTVSARLDAEIAPIVPYLPRPYDQSLTASLVVSQPLFASGLNSSKIRQAQAEDERAALTIEATRRGVLQQVAQAWDQVSATRSAIALQQRQLDAQTLAVQGERLEERAGLRATIELLNAELELSNARTGLIQSRHDEYVARATLLSAMGLLEARLLVPDLAAYSPQEALRRVENRLTKPWEDAVSVIDRLGAPSNPPPPMSAPDAAGRRPADMPPLVSP
jgi:outer membrane protein